MADEKYRLTLEGSDIDEALLRLANYEDEGLVLGSRKGVMLGPESEYYHKNARYYAELAQSAVPGDTTSAVRWDIDQSALTDADREMARKNIRAGGSNDNLLDNGWFTVRQRGNGPWTTAVYTADRWKNTGANQSTALTSQGLVIQQVNNGYDGVEQKLPADLSAALVGSALTLSINCLSVSGTYRYRMRFFNGGSLISAKFGGIPSAGLYSVTMDEVPANTNLIVVDFFTNSGRAGDTITVAAIKLEKSSISTLAYDAPPKYAEELRNCQYYFKRFSPTAYTALWSGIAVNQTMGGFFVEGEMRDVRPVVTVSGTGYMAQEGSMKLITSGEAYHTRQGTRLLFTTSATLTNNKPVTVYTSANQNFVVDISADL